jgi:NTE family protein
MEAGIYPDIVAGTSMGAVAGACYATDKLDALEDFACTLTRRRLFGFLDFNFAGSGLINGQRVASRLDHHFEGLDIDELPRKFVAVATELGTGHEIWLRKGHLVSALKASYALPGIFRPVQIDGRWLFDGALVNPIPVSVCRALGARIVIAVSLSCDLISRGGVIHDQDALIESLPSPDEAEIPKGNGRAAVHLLHRQLFGRGTGAPGISAVMMDAINITQDRIARSRLAGDPPDITISPKVGSIALFDFHRAREAVEIGAAAAKKQLDEIQHALHIVAA